LNIFIDKYPQFEVVEQRVIPNYLRYLLSGGLNFRQLMPSFLEPVIRLFEFVLTPLHPVLGLHHCIIIRKRLNHQ